MELRDALHVSTERDAHPPTLASGFTYYQVHPPPPRAAFLPGPPRNPPAVGRAAIVTASDSGIGKAAVALAGAGYDLGITWHSDEVRSLGRSAEVR
ncbi:MAG TPA: hypothetical protein VE757_06745, partial [Gaiellaceae bacterium]|nr:hypothetical protein [Gaiellaceae bacterium]